jgi:ElaB/YqjD/DUF883 family membrane-anchored ribosome-binding protein
MPDQSEVIMGQMEETRKGLTEKLETLEKKVAGTVETVTESVQAVENTVENVTESIQETVATVTDTVQNTVDAVGETVSNTVENVKSFFDIAHHVDQHPWLMLGGSVLAGYLGGWLLTPRTVRVEAPTSPSPTRHNGASYLPPPEPVAAAKETERAEETGESWLGKLGERFEPEVEKLKGLAVGTLFGVARDMISQWLPGALKDQVTDVINSFTTDLGGKVIREPLLAPQETRDESEHCEPPNQPKAADSQSTGASSRKTDKAGASSGRR